ncbi:MAG: hypothetical protein KKA62_02935 [Nanoarchaeota archaeon]|nr:hypothetical protein [Nanoarchaeota archaeon]MBU1644627.1 hypothetical protein [Nanoarchaeota archaeon]MBU1976886.1 hypothetical protein [Nanoarchaeota archaeon]
MIQKKKDLIDVIAENYKPNITEDNEKIFVVNRNRFNEALERYKKSLAVKKPLLEERLVLTPSEINLLLQASQEFQNRPEYVNITNIFITRLIQTSFEKGYNHFFLNLKNMNAPYCFASTLNGTRDRFLTIEVEGDIGPYGASNIQYVEFTLRGNAEANYGNKAKQSCFYIYGDTERDCTSFIDDCIVVIHGSAESIGRESRNSIFKTNFKSNISKMKKDLPLGNDIYLIRAGQEEKKIIRVIEVLNNYYEIGKKCIQLLKNEKDR